MQTQTHYRTCHLCETMCGIAVEHDGENILSIKGDPDHVLSKGNICPKAIGLQDIHTDPDRLSHPVKRVGDEWVEISWDEAFEETATRLADIQHEYGNNAVATYQGRSTAHNIGALLTVHPMRVLVDRQNTFTGSTVDQQPHNFVWYFMLGHQFMATVPNIDRTDYFLLLGSNPSISNGAMKSTGANTWKKLDAIRERGGKVVLIDPRRTESAEHASEHHFIQPASDALFLIGLINTIFAKKLANPGRLKPHIKNSDTIEPALAEYQLSDIARITGISGADIERIATEFATSPTAVCYGRTGLSMQTFGGLCNWFEPSRTQHYVGNSIRYLTAIHFHRIGCCVKRLFDIFFSLTGLIVASPVLLILAILVRIWLGSPVLFKQMRPGLQATPFQICKFRTMTNARNSSGELLPDAIRLTGFGRFLRASSLDELPELWNVLKGDMSFVGPRPLLTEYVPLYDDYQARRHELRPGITGWAQVKGRNALSWDEKFALDIWYVENQNLWLDIKILFMTIASVLRREGIDSGEDVPMPKFTGNEAKD